MARLLRSYGTSQIDRLQFKVLTAPIVVTNAATSIATTSVTGNGTLTSDGNSVLTQQGFCWSTSSNPTTADSTATVTPTITGAYSATLSGLTSNTLYHYRAYAINVFGTSYGADTTFTTSAVAAAAFIPTLLLIGVG